MTGKFPTIISSMSGPAGSKVKRCRIRMEYDEDRHALIEFDVHDALARGDINEAWREELRRVADALLVAASR